MICDTISGVINNRVKYFLNEHFCVHGHYGHTKAKSLILCRPNSDQIKELSHEMVDVNYKGTDRLSAPQPKSIMLIEESGVI